MWIENKGQIMAKNVQVFADSLWVIKSNGNKEKVKNFIPMNFKWSHSQGKEIKPEIFAEAIAPKMGKHCDFGHIIRPTKNEINPRTGYGYAGLELDLEVIPNNRSDILLPGEYLLKLKIAASNSKPKTVNFYIKFSGVWYENIDEMFGEGVILSKN